MLNLNSTSFHFDFRSDHSKYGNGTKPTNGDVNDSLENFYFSNSATLLPHARKNILMVIF